MSLSFDFEAATATPAPKLSPALREALGMPAEEFRLILPTGNCTRVPAEGSGEVDIPYNYNIVVKFDSRESRDEFISNPNMYHNRLSIEKLTESMMQETLNLENARDADKSYETGIPYDEKLIEGISANTIGDAGIVMQEVTAITKSTFPDAGIESVEIEDLRGRESSCPYPGNWNIASLDEITPAPSSVSGTAFTQTLGR